MPRPLRLEYPDAFYHVMNRGRGRQAIFHGPAYYQAFLDCLAQAHERFGAIIHAYCLMGNHYHLLLQTPNANLSRIMRHINGVYTQHYNWRKKTDGPLFRGRFKSIVVDEDAYLLQVSRYIHRNPIETKKPLVKILEHYPWSSYPAYLDKAKSPEWLQRDFIYQSLGKRQYRKAYALYVENGIDEETKQFYNKGNLASVIGDKLFRESLLEEQSSDVQDEIRVHGVPDVEVIVKLTAKAFKVSKDSIIKRKPGRQASNLPRKIAMLLCQTAGYSLKQQVECFGVSNSGTISNAIWQAKKNIGDDKQLAKIVEGLKKNVWT